DRDYSPPTDGARYDPITDSWQPMASTAGDYRYSKAVWAGDEVFVWNDTLPSVRYHPETDNWLPVSGETSMGRRQSLSVVGTGREVLVWGGRLYGAGARPAQNFQDGARYDPQTDSWAPISATDAPEGRWGHSSAWTGTEMIT